MRRFALLATALCLFATPVLAQGEGGSGIRLSTEQSRALYQNLIASRTAPLPEGTRIEVGERLPRSARTYGIPPKAAPASLRRYRYAVANQRVALVDPSNRRIVHILGVGF